VHHYSGFVLALAGMNGVPVRIAHSHNDTRGEKASASLARRAYLHAMGWLLPLVSTGGFAVSSEAGDSLYPAGWRRDSRWTLAHLGIDLSQFRESGDRDTIRSRLGLDDSALVVGHVGRFDPQKNHRFFVEVAAEFLKVSPHAQFLLVGDGPLRPVIMQRVAELGIADRFIFTGVRGDVPDMFAAMDMLFFPSVFEGLPLSILEAQAAGLPSLLSDSITTEADVIPELIIRESLAAPLNHWVAALSRTSRLARGERSKCCERMRGRSIENSTEHLLGEYEKHASKG
jgi:glycosyltransferase involved in cell wall biosynthesis